MSWGLIIGPCGVCDICSWQHRHKWWCWNQPRRKAFWRFIKHRKIEDLIDILFWNTMENQRTYWYYEPFIRLLESAKFQDKMHSSIQWYADWQRMKEQDGYSVDLFFTPLKGIGSDGHGFGFRVDEKLPINKTIKYWERLQKK